MPEVLKSPSLNPASRQEAGTGGAQVAPVWVAQVGAVFPDYYPAGNFSSTASYSGARTFDRNITWFSQIMNICTGSYRYGFNGQEKVDEIAGAGNSYTAEFWQYDPRIGRRWNVDPVVKIHESPYACFANNPIWFMDPNGADSIKMEDGTWGWRVEPGDSPSKIASITGVAKEELARLNYGHDFDNNSHFAEPPEDGNWTEYWAQPGENFRVRTGDVFRLEPFPWLEQFSFPTPKEMFYWANTEEFFNIISTDHPDDLAWKKKEVAKAKIVDVVVDVISAVFEHPQGPILKSQEVTNVINIWECMRRLRTLGERDGDGIQVAMVMYNADGKEIGAKILKYNKGEINISDYIYPTK